MTEMKTLTIGGTTYEVVDDKAREDIKKLQEAEPTEGADGGHYTPSVKDNGDGTMTISFTASKEGMAAVNPVTVSLPTAKDGTDGEDGTSVTVSSVTESTESGGENVVEFSDGKTVTIKNGKDGDPYTLTPTDKADIVKAVIESLGGQPVAGYFDENNDIVLTSTLPDGTYTFKIETSDGVYELGTLTKETTINKYTVTFVADGVTVKVVEYEEGATSLDPNDVPDVPAKDGYTGVWESYTLEDTNITVEAVYTEVVVEPSYTNLLDEVGYKEGYKMSTSTGDESQKSGADASGYIPVSSGKILRIANVTLSTEANINNIIFYDDSQTKLGYWLGVAGAFSANVLVNNGVYYFTPSLAYANTGYIRFSCGNIDSNSIVTLGEEIE